MTAVDPATALRGDTPSANGAGPGHHADAPGPAEPYSHPEMARMNLGGLVRRPPPPLKVRLNLIYERRMHTLSGPPESGKTVLALYLALEYMRHGMNVLMLDEETGGRQVADLLRSMGADPDMIERHLYYMYGLDRPWDGAAIDQLGEVCKGFKPQLAIFDSMAEMLAASGMDENSSADVTRFWRLVLRPVAQNHHASVLLIDHDAKDAKPDSRYSRGAGAKLATPDVALKVRALRPFSRHQEGLLALTVSKDRLGDLPNRHYRVRVRIDPRLDMEFNKTTAAEAQGEDSGMSPSAEKLLAVLTAEPQTNQQLVDKIVAKYGHGLRRETVSKSLGWLQEAGLADRMDLGRGQAALWLKTDNALFKPGQAAEEEPAPLPPEPGGGWPQDSLGYDANL